MKKSTKILLSIIIILIIIMGIGYYLLTPKEKVSKNSNNKIINIEELLQHSSVDKFELVKDPLRLKGRISISADEFQNIIYTIMDNYNARDLKYTNVDINDNKIKIISPYKALGFIDSQLEVNLIPSVVENKLNILLTDAKLGKINISDKILKERLNELKKQIPFTIENNRIIVDESHTYPISFNNIEITKKNIIIDLEVKADNLIDFIYKYKINVK